MIPRASIPVFAAFVLAVLAPQFGFAGSPDNALAARAGELGRRVTEIVENVALDLQTGDIRDLDAATVELRDLREQIDRIKDTVDLESVPEYKDRQFIYDQSHFVRHLDETLRNANHLAVESASERRNAVLRLKRMISVQRSAGIDFDGSPKLVGAGSVVDVRMPIDPSKQDLDPVHVLDAKKAKRLLSANKTQGKFARLALEGRLIDQHDVRTVKALKLGPEGNMGSGKWELGFCAYVSAVNSLYALFLQEGLDVKSFSATPHLLTARLIRAAAKIDPTSDAMAGVTFLTLKQALEPLVEELSRGRKSLGSHLSSYWRDSPPTARALQARRNRMTLLSATRGGGRPHAIVGLGLDEKHDDFLYWNPHDGAHLYRSDYSSSYYGQSWPYTKLPTMDWPEFTPAPGGGKIPKAASTGFVTDALDLWLER